MPRERPSRETSGVHLRLGDRLITGMTPKVEDGTVLAFQTLSGWWDAPSTTGATTQYLAADGGWNNTAYWTPRVIELSGILAGDSRAQVRDGVERLMRAIPKDALEPLVVMEDGLTRHCMVRMAGDPVADWVYGPHLAVSWNIQLVAPDPRRLAGSGVGGDGWTVLTTGLPATTGGLTFPTLIPFLIPATSASGRVRLGYGGTSTPNAIVEFNGPVSKPGVRDSETGDHLWFDIELAAGETLTVDLRTRVTTLNGVSRRGTRRGQWINVRNGVTLEFTAGTYNPDATMVVRTQEAWI